jgi:hypothetical protein
MHFFEKAKKAIIRADIGPNAKNAFHLRVNSEKAKLTGRCPNVRKKRSKIALPCETTFAPTRGRIVIRR